MQLLPLDNLKNELIYKLTDIDEYQATNVVAAIIKLLPQKFANIGTQIIFEENELPEYNCLNCVMGKICTYFGPAVIASFVVVERRLKVYLTFTEEFFK
jgi:hypothetical protein